MAGGAKDLQIVDIVGSPLRPGHDMVDFKDRPFRQILPPCRVHPREYVKLDQAVLTLASGSRIDLAAKFSRDPTHSEFFPCCFASFALIHPLSHRCAFVRPENGFGCRGTPARKARRPRSCGPSKISPGRFFGSQLIRSHSRMTTARKSWPGSKRRTSAARFSWPLPPVLH